MCLYSGHPKSGLIYFKPFEPLYSERLMFSPLVVIDSHGKIGRGDAPPPDLNKLEKSWSQKIEENRKKGRIVRKVREMKKTQTSAENVSFHPSIPLTSLKFKGWPVGGLKIGPPKIVPPPRFRPRVKVCCREIPTIFRNANIN